jgi:hypothetical protein
MRVGSGSFELEMGRAPKNPEAPDRESGSAAPGGSESICFNVDL